MKLKLLNNNEEEKSFLYRYADGWNKDIYIHQYEIVKETPCGYWVKKWVWDWDNDDLKFVYKQGKNNFAKKTKKEALENYYHRKCRHVSILKIKLENAERLLRLAERKTGREKQKSVENIFGEFISNEQ